MAHKTHELPWYVAGPMSYIPKFNVPAFMDARQKLEARGYKVQLPADLDDPRIVEQLLLSPDGAHNSEDTGGLTWADCLALDIKLIGDKCCGVAVIDVWQKSRGARLETYVAALVGKPIVYASSMRAVPKAQLQRAFVSVINS